jgi:hypothetical protein
LWIAVVVSLLFAIPVAARPKDPDSFRWLPRKANASLAEQRGDAVTLVSAQLQPASAVPMKAHELMRDAANAVGSAGALEFRLDMQTTLTNIRGGSWTTESTLAGHYTAPDRLDGVLTIVNPWATTQARVNVADGKAGIANPETGKWEEGLKLATSYYPVIFTGCLLRMAEADMDSLKLIGIEVLDGEPVHHLKGPGGARDELEIEYWLGVDDSLPRRAVVRTQARTGWSDEAHTIQITATLRLGNHGRASAILPSR